MWNCVPFVNHRMNKLWICLSVSISTNGYMLTSSDSQKWWSEFDLIETIKCVYSRCIDTLYANWSQHWITHPQQVFLTVSLISVLSQAIHDSGTGCTLCRSWSSLCIVFLQVMYTRRSFIIIANTTKRSSKMMINELSKRKLMSCDAERENCISVVLIIYEEQS